MTATPEIPDELLRAWTATRIVLDGPPAVPLTGPDAHDEWPFNGELFVITAANPRSRRLDPADNAVRNAELAAALRERGHRVLAATAGLDDWNEPSLAVPALDRDTAGELARDFDQLGWFELDAEQVRILATRTGQVLHEGPRRHP